MGQRWRGATSLRRGRVRSAEPDRHRRHPVLARWGQRDRAKALLRESIATREGLSQAIAQSNLAMLLLEEGKLAEALATGEAVYQTFQEAGARRQMAEALAQMGLVYQNMGDFEKAIEMRTSDWLDKNSATKNTRRSACTSFSMLYRLKEDFPAALARSQEAEALFRKLGIEAHVAATLHEQGLIYLSGPRRGR